MFFRNGLVQRRSLWGEEGIRVYERTTEVISSKNRYHAFCISSQLDNNGVEMVTSCSNVPNLSLNILSSWMVSLTTSMQINKRTKASFACLIDYSSTLLESFHTYYAKIWIWTYKHLVWTWVSRWFNYKWTGVIPLRSDRSRAHTIGDLEANDRKCIG